MDGCIIWEARNDARNNATEPSCRRVAEKIKAYAETIVQHLSKTGTATRCDLSSSVLKWSPPPAGLALINVDVALFSSSSSMGMGVVIRDNDARCLVACNERLEHVTDPELAEALACRRGLNLARDEGFSKTPTRKTLAAAIPPKKKVPVKAAKAPTKAPTKPRTVAPKEKPTTMSQEAWDEEKRRCAMVTVDRRRRRIAAEAYKAEATKAVAATDVCLSLGGGQPEGSQQLAGRSSTSSPGYFAEGPSLSQMRLSQMDAHLQPQHAVLAGFGAEGQRRLSLPRRPELVIDGGAEILSGFIRHGHGYEPPVDEYEEEADEDEDDAEEVEAEVELIDTDTGVTTTTKRKRRGCKKWDAIRLTLNKDDVGEDGPVDPAGASTGLPIGNKKAKAERNAAESE
ncbi:hypothetical protein QYE76_017309 [Lolium multiflorum]|uniref:RNase H type-1 domain-containing protein n=1 Tax=Lolium multiflorum TaxID=4521 RepID=A0AAD8QFM3_LOLMU|nr:hypothetical protein QYE76_017309 [Lolium multiflorum]